MTIQMLLQEKANNLKYSVRQLLSHIHFQHFQNLANVLSYCLIFLFSIWKILNALAGFHYGKPILLYLVYFLPYSLAEMIKSRGLISKKFSVSRSDSAAKPIMYQILQRQSFKTGVFFEIGDSINKHYLLNSAP